MVLVMCMALSMGSYALAIENNEGIETDYEIAEEIQVVNSDNEVVEVELDEELVDTVDKETIEKIVDINSDQQEIEIKSEENFLELDEIPEQITVITDDEAVVNIEVNSDITDEVEPEEIMDIIEQNDLEGYETIAIDSVEQIEYDDDEFYSFQKVDDMESEAVITDDEKVITELEKEIQKQEELGAIEDFIQQSDEIENFGTQGGIEPQWRWYDLYLSWTTSRSYGSEYVDKDVFITSVAKGETISLKKKFTSSLGLSLESGAVYDSASAKSGLTSKVTYSVEKKHKYKGPSEKSKYNTREYRVQFYAKKCYVKQKVKGYPSKHVTTYKATYEVPVKYYSYSIDKNIK